MDYFSKDEEAARALQELHSHPRSMESPNRAGAKRSRTQSIDNSLQENVREMLSNQYQQSAWSDDFIKSQSTRMMENGSSAQIALQPLSSTSFGRKRVCCAAEAARGLSQSNIHPVFGGFGGPGMWEGILN